MPPPQRHADADAVQDLQHIFVQPRVTGVLHDVQCLSLLLERRVDLSHLHEHIADARDRERHRRRLLGLGAMTNLSHRDRQQAHRHHQGALVRLELAEQREEQFQLLVRGGPTFLGELRCRLVQVLALHPAVMQKLKHAKVAVQQPDVAPALEERPEVRVDQVHPSRFRHGAELLELDLNLRHDVVRLVGAHGARCLRRLGNGQLNVDQDVPVAGRVRREEAILNADDRTVQQTHSLGDLRQRCVHFGNRVAHNVGPLDVIQPRDRRTGLAELVLFHGLLMSGAPVLQREDVLLVQAEALPLPLLVPWRQRVGPVDHRPHEFAEDVSPVLRGLIEFGQRRRHLSVDVLLPHVAVVGSPTALREIKVHVFGEDFLRLRRIPLPFRLHRALAIHQRLQDGEELLGGAGRMLQPWRAFGAHRLFHYRGRLQADDRVRLEPSHPRGLGRLVHDPRACLAAQQPLPLGALLLLLRQLLARSCCRHDANRDRAEESCEGPGRRTEESFARLGRLRLRSLRRLRRVGGELILSFVLLRRTATFALALDLVLLLLGGAGSRPRQRSGVPVLLGCVAFWAGLDDILRGLLFLVFLAVIRLDRSQSPRGLVNGFTLRKLSGSVMSLLHHGSRRRWLRRVGILFEVLEDAHPLRDPVLSFQGCRAHRRTLILHNFSNLAVLVLVLGIRAAVAHAIGAEDII
eukprot:scaffold7040_cov256-Pinguiococcus_pyrenoidosus.AAC.1